MTTIRVRIDHDGEEFVVRHPRNIRADYFTTDRQDALDTAKVLVWLDCNGAFAQPVIRRVPVCAARHAR